MDDPVYTTIDELQKKLDHIRANVKNDYFICRTDEALEILARLKQQVIDLDQKLCNACGEPGPRDWM